MNRELPGFFHGADCALPADLCRKPSCSCRRWDKRRRKESWRTALASTRLYFLRSNSPAAHPAILSSDLQRRICVAGFVGEVVLGPGFCQAHVPDVFGDQPFARAEFRLAGSRADDFRMLPDS